jgi:hypothetical protein
MDELNNFGLSLRDDGLTPRDAAELYARLRAQLDHADKLSELLLAAPQQDIAAALHTVEHITHRKQFIQSAADIISPPALLKLARAAGLAYQRPVSKPLDSLLEKLAREADELPAPGKQHASQSFRSLVKQITETWSLNSLDMGATDFESLFETEYDPLQSSAGSAAPEPQRVLQMAFETGALGKPVWTAVTVLGEDAGIDILLNMLKRVPPGNRAADAVGQQLANPLRVSLLLQADPVDFSLIDALLPRMGDTAPGVLLESITESRNPEVRRGLLERISQFGPDIIPLVVGRLKNDERWYVQRNMLAILRDLKAPASLIAIERYLTHSDPRVRREAMQLQFNDPLQRDRALMIAFKENDNQTLKLALQSARHGFPDVAVPVLAKRVAEPGFPPEFRMVALQLLARTRSMLALEALLRFVAGGTTLLGKPKLAAKSPEMLIALTWLARNYAADRRVAPLLAIARESKDRDIAGAVQRGTATETTT